MLSYNTVFGLEEQVFVIRGQTGLGVDPSVQSSSCHQLRLQDELSELYLFMFYVTLKV